MSSTNPNSLDNQGEFHARAHPGRRHSGEHWVSSADILILFYIFSLTNP